MDGWRIFEKLRALFVDILGVALIDSKPTKGPKHVYYHARSLDPLPNLKIRETSLLGNWDNYYSVERSTPIEVPIHLSLNSWTTLADRIEILTSSP